MGADNYWRKVDEDAEELKRLRTQDEVLRSAAGGLLARIFEVYRPEYVVKAAAADPQCLLAWAERLREALERP